jgi:hypothetical protein
VIEDSLNGKFKLLKEAADFLREMVWYLGCSVGWDAPCPQERSRCVVHLD